LSLTTVFSRRSTTFPRLLDRLSTGFSAHGIHRIPWKIHGFFTGFSTCFHTNIQQCEAYTFHQLFRAYSERNSGPDRSRKGRKASGIQNLWKTGWVGGETTSGGGQLIGCTQVVARGTVVPPRRRDACETAGRRPALPSSRQWFRLLRSCLRPAGAPQIARCAFRLERTGRRRLPAHRLRASGSLV